jgi:hypothetical protein
MDAATLPAVLPSVTVLMPVHNGVPFLQDQVLSILEQDGVNVRLVARDDASTDNSWALLKRLSNDHDRLVVRRNARNVGLVGTLAVLLTEVDTSYFALADQDDVWYRRKLRTSIQQLQAEDVDLVYSNVQLGDEAGDVVMSDYLHGRHIRPLRGKDAIPFAFRNPVVGHTIVGTHALARLAMPIPRGLAHHESWFVTIACTQKGVSFVDEALGMYRVHRNNAVGPRRGGATALRHLHESVNRLETRQGSRISALSLSPTQRAGRFVRELDAFGGRRCFFFPRFALRLLRYVGAIGPSAVVSEIVAYLWITASQILSRRRRVSGTQKSKETC